MRRWVRVRDKSTGYEFDVREDTLPRPGLSKVRGAPLTRRPRPASTTPAGKPETDSEAAPSDGPNKEESANGTT